MGKKSKKKSRDILLDWNGWNFPQFDRNLRAEDVSDGELRRELELDEAEDRKG